MKKSLVLVLCSLMILVLKGQNEKLRYGGHFGYPIGIFDVAPFAIHLSGGIEYRAWRYFSGFGSLVYNYEKFNRTDDFFGHDGGVRKAYGFLLGGKAYFTSPERKIRPSIQFGLGFGKASDKEFNANNDILIEESAIFAHFMSHLLINNMFEIGGGLENRAIVLRAGFWF